MGNRDFKAQVNQRKSSSITANLCESDALNSKLWTIRKINSKSSFCCSLQPFKERGENPKRSLASLVARAWGHKFGLWTFRNSLRSLPSLVEEALHPLLRRVTCQCRVFALGGLRFLARVRLLVQLRLLKARTRVPRYPMEMWADPGIQLMSELRRKSSFCGRPLTSV